MWWCQNAEFSLAVICCSCKLPIFSGLNLKMCVIFAACAVVVRYFAVFCIFFAVFFSQFTAFSTCFCCFFIRVGAYHCQVALLLWWWCFEWIFKFVLFLNFLFLYFFPRFFRVFLYFYISILRSFPEKKCLPELHLSTDVRRLGRDVIIFSVSPFFSSLFHFFLLFLCILLAKSVWVLRVRDKYSTIDDVHWRTIHAHV